MILVCMAFVYLNALIPMNLLPDSLQFMRNFRYANYSISLFFQVDHNSEQDSPFLKILISIQRMFFVILHFLSFVGQKNVQFNEKEMQHENP